MNRKLVPNDQRERIKDLLPGQKGDPGQTGRDNRLLIETVRWIAPTRSPASCLWQLTLCLQALLRVG